MQKTIDVLDFLICNEQQIIEDIKPSVKKFIKRGNIFTGIYRIHHENYFKDYVLYLIKQIILDNLTINFEELEIIFDADTTKLINFEKRFLERNIYEN